MSLTDTDLAALRPILGRVSFFEFLDPAELDALAAAVEKRPFAAGDEIIRQGDPGDAFYILGSGAVTVTRQDPDGRHRLKTFEAGNFFGEIALVQDVNRTATVTGERPGDLYRLSREAFDRVLMSNKLVGDIIRYTAQKRLADGAAGDAPAA